MESISEKVIADMTHKQQDNLGSQLETAFMIVHGIRRAKSSQLIVIIISLPKQQTMVKILQYDILKDKVISRNNQSDIFVAQKLDNLYAAKLIIKELSEQHCLGLKRQKLILSSIDSPYVIKYVDYVQSDKYAVLLTELAKQDLRHRIDQKHLSFEQSRNIMKDLLMGIQSIHDHHIIHRNIDPTNVLFTHKEQLKIIDFGRACFTNELQTQAFHGGITGYQAPEQLINILDVRCDIWSAGVIFYELIFGRLPFTIEDRLNYQEYIHEIKIKTNPFKISTQYYQLMGQDFCSSIEQFLNLVLVDYQKRPSIMTLLNHRIFSVEFQQKSIKQLPVFKESSSEFFTKQYDSKILPQSKSTTVAWQEIKFKLLYRSLDYLGIIDKDRARKTLLIFRVYMLRMAVIFALELHRQYPTDATLENEYYTINSEFELEQYQFNQMYPLEPQLSLQDYSSYHELKAEFKRYCEVFSKLAFELYEKQNKNTTNKILLIRLCLRITILSLCNKLFTGFKYESLLIMQHYLKANKIWSFQLFNSFLDKLSFQKILMYLNDFTKSIP